MKNLLILEKWTPLVHEISEISEISPRSSRNLGRKNAALNDNRCITFEQILW